MPATATNLPAIRDEIASRQDEYRLALANDAPADKFVRSVFLQFEREPKLYDCDRVSILEAVNRAAIDGLLLDGREAALVIFKDRNRGPVATYMPMYQGLLKRIYKSGAVSTVAAHIVWTAELDIDPALGRPRFVFHAGDDEKIIHDPIIVGDKGKPALVYSIVRMRDGTMSRDVMSMDRVMTIAKRAGRGELKDVWKSDFLEMAKKTVLRHHTKTLPKDARLESVLDHMQNVEPVTQDDDIPDETPQPARKKRGAAAEKLTPKPETKDAETIDPETGEIESEGAGDEFPDIA